MKPQTSPASFQTPASDSGFAFFWGGVGGGGGGGAGRMMTTLLRRHPEQHLRKSHFTRYLQYFRDVSHLI